MIHASPSKIRQLIGTGGLARAVLLPVGLAGGALILGMMGLPAPANAFEQSGIASYYWQPQMTASGERFNPNAMTAAHKTLPMGTRVRVTHEKSGRSVVVRINDRGPFVRGRIIDLSKRAAGVLGMHAAGVARVKVAIVGKGDAKAANTKAARQVRKKSSTGTARANGRSAAKKKYTF